MAYDDQFEPDEPEFGEMITCPGCGKQYEWVGKAHVCNPCPVCHGRGHDWVDDATDTAAAQAEAMGTLPPCAACNGSGFDPKL